MKRKKRMRHVKRRLMAGLFCISLLFADLGTVIPAWAKEPVVAEQSQGSGESELDETRNPDEENQEEAVQNPDENNSVEDEANLDGEDDGSQSQSSDEGNAGDDVQSTDERNDEDGAQKPNDGNDEGNVPGSDGENDGDDTQDPDAEDDVIDDTAGTPDLPEEDELAEAEETDSVSENDLEAQGEVRTLAASGADIASGTYGDITWVIDANGKLTVEGTGDFASSYSTGSSRAPWYSKHGYIKSAEINVTGMTDASYMFEWCYNMTDVDLKGLDTSTITNMSNMFHDCTNKNLNINVSGFNTQSVTDMSYMFGDCKYLQNLDLSSFNTNNVKSMAGMFSGCAYLKNINLGQNFTTRSVTDMSSMFSGCTKLESVNYKQFNTDNVTNMASMFSGCRALGNLDLSGWNTSKVTDMSYMFLHCGGDGRYKFGGITLGGSFTTCNVKKMDDMFAYGQGPVHEDYGGPIIPENEDRRNLVGLDLAWLDLGSVESMHGIFGECNVKGLDLSKLDTSKTKTLRGLFANCDMTDVDFSGLRTETITDMSRMFDNCKGTINLHTLNTENVTDMSYMFVGGSGGVGGYRPPVNKLMSLDLSGLNTENVTDMSGMFQFQNELTSLNLNGLNTANVTDMAVMFWSCSSLTSIDLGSLDCANVTEMGEMFDGCSKLSELNLGNLGTGNLVMIEEDGDRYSPLYRMFNGCESLKTLDLSRFDCANLTAVSVGVRFDESLVTIYTPYNVRNNELLPAGDWYMADGTKLEDNCLPKNLPYSVLIQKGSVPSVSAAHMEVSKKKTVYGCGETIGTDDLTVTYYGMDGSVRKLTEEEYTTNAASLNTNEPGTLELIITCNKDGKTLTGKITLTVAHILSADNTVITLPSEADYDYTYDGQPKLPKPVTVSYAKKTGDGTETTVTLMEGTDYTVSYRNNINAYKEPVEDGAGDGADTATAAVNSTAAAPTVIIKGTGSYSGTATQTFAIKKAQAPAAEEKTVTASQCTQARPNRTADLSDSFADFGKKTGYEVINVEDTDNIFSRTPVTADIKDGILTYGTNAAQENDTAAITVRVSFANYGDAELTVKIVMASKKGVVISGIIMPEDTTYTGTPITYDGAASVAAEDGTDVTGQVTLVYSYSGTMADGKAYPESSGAEGSGPQSTEPPVNAGSYVLTVAVAEDDEEYTGSTEYPFTISPAAVTVRAGDIVDVMQGNQEASKPAASYQSEFRYDIEGLLLDDGLVTEPVYTVTDLEGQAVTQINMTKESVYNIVPSGADAGMNYAITYVNGTLTVTAERVVYTVRFDCMGHGSSFVKSGIKAGSLLELSENELAPEAEGYLFAGWYKDQTFAKGKEWNFDTDTVQSDLTLYACWLTSPAEDGSGLKLCVQEIPDLTYTGSALKPAVTVYDSDGTTLLKSGKDYTVKYVRNTNAVAVGEDGEPTVAGGTAKVENPGKANEKITDVIGHFSSECPYVVITGKGNYTETVYRNFRILPADIAATGEADNTPLATGFTLKYTDQFEAKANKTAKIVSSFKYKKALKADTDYVLSVQDENGAEVALTQGKLPLNAGNYALIIQGTGNYTGAVRRSLYVADGQKLMKNASVTYTKTVKAESADDLSKGIEQKGVIVKIKGQEIPADNYTIDYAGTNHTVGTATMTLTGKNGYVGSKSVTFKITGMSFSAKTVEVKAYDVNHPDEKDWKASVPYTGKAVTQNKVTLTTKVTQNNPTAQTLTYGEHYNITYKNNIKKGTATMIFTAKPESGYSGSFKKTFKITAQDLSVDMFRKVLADGTTAQKQLTVVSVDGNKKNVTVKWDEDAVHAKNGASLSFILCNPAGMALKQGTDYTVSYKDHKAATKASAGATVITGSKQPIMTVKGKGNYGGTLTVQFQIIPASITSDSLTVTAAQVQKKNGMKLKDFKLKVMDGKAVLKEGTDYTIDVAGCTPEMIKAYADSLDTGTTAPEPKLVLTGIGNYGAKTSEGDAASGTKEISLADYIYVTKLTTKNLKAEVIGDRTYTGQNIEPAVKVSYYKDNNAAQKDGVGVELTNGTDYKVIYGNKNIPAGKKKGSITVTGAGIYGGSVTVKFDIEKKQIY